MAAITQHIESFKLKLNKALNEKNAFTNVLDQIEQKTGVSKLYIASGLIAVLALYLMIGYGAQFVCNFVGFIYPAYMSVKAVESVSKDDDTQWLTYWVVYSFFHLLEFFSDIFLFWIPFYWFLKCCFLVWCFSSVEWNGSAVIYSRVIRPFILRHQTKIDAALDKAKGAAMEVIGLVSSRETISQRVSDQWSDTTSGHSIHVDYRNKKMVMLELMARELAEEVATEEVIKRATSTLKDD